jgi:hypothetical protein
VKPDGVTQLSRWAFFIKPAKWADPLDPCSEPADDNTSIMGEYPFRFRFAPNELSNGIPWTFNITIRNPQNLPGFPQYHFTGFEFYCDAPLSNNHGYLEVASNNQFLKFEDGTPFFGIGYNLNDVRKWDAVGSCHYQEYEKDDHRLFKLAIEDLANAGGNFMRSYLFKYNFAPEWEHLGVYDAYESVNCCPDGSSTNGTQNRIGNRQWSCWLFDEILEHCKEHEVYLQLCIDPFPPVIAYQNFIWGDNAYVREYVYPTGTPINGGPPNGWYDGPYHHEKYLISSTTDPENEGAMYYWKRKYKYILSRWGYSV